jgi:hypothetical protein
MANGCDVTESDVTGSDATGIRRPKVGDSPWRVILFEEKKKKVNATSI